MKIAAVLGVALAEQVTSENFVVVPDGYHGFFDGWNVTQLIAENVHDEIFHAFENEVS